MKIVGPEYRGLWWVSLSTWKGVCCVYRKPKGWSVIFFLLVGMYLVTVCRLGSLRPVLRLKASFDLVQ